MLALWWIYTIERMPDFLSILNRSQKRGNIILNYFVRLLFPMPLSQNSLRYSDMQSIHFLQAAWEFFYLSWSCTIECWFYKIWLDMANTVLRPPWFHMVTTWRPAYLNFLWKDNILFPLDHLSSIFLNPRPRGVGHSLEKMNTEIQGTPLTQRGFEPTFPQFPSTAL